VGLGARDILPRWRLTAVQGRHFARSRFAWDSRAAESLARAKLTRPLPLRVLKSRSRRSDSEGTPPREGFVLSGLVAERDGASCSVLVVETETVWKNRSALSPLLKGVVDSPWRDVREHEERRSDAAEFLRLMLTAGAYTVKALPH